MSSAVRLVPLVFAASAFSMAGSSTFAALLPGFVAEWHLSNTQAGWISGIYYAGYAAAVPVLVALTDRVDARRVYLGSAALTAVAMFCFTALANGFWTAMLFHALAGAGLAGTYMPGLKILTDRIEGPARIRAVPYYTVNFGIGNALSFLAAGLIAPGYGWRAAFAAGGLGALIALTLVATAVRPHAPALPAPERHLLDFRPVLSNRAAMGYVLGYFGHTWELLATRAWLVAFLSFSLGLQAGGGADWSATTIATLVVFAGVPASVLGAELAVRRERRRIVARVMLTSSILSPLLGLCASLPFPAVVAISVLYGVALMADSGALTAGAVAAAHPSERGATMAVHSLLGFTGGFIGPLAAGLVLDLAGGAKSPFAWVLAFAAIGAGSAIGRWFVTHAARDEELRN